jgi:hypothetical protein
LRWVLPPPLALASRSTLERICLPQLPTSLDDARLVAALPPQGRPSVKRHTTSTGLSTGCPSGSALAYPLGPTNPPRIILAAEPLGFRWWGFAPHFSVTHSGIRTRERSTAGLRCRFDTLTTLPYHSGGSPPLSAASAHDFAPLDYRRTGTRPVSCYALFQGWLLLSQPPGCFRTVTSFTTQS